MDNDLETMSREQLVAEVRKLRDGIRKHRDSTGHELCWHHPALWGLLPEKSDPVPIVPAWPQFMAGCIRYRQSLDQQAPDVPRSHRPYSDDDTMSRAIPSGWHSVTPRLVVQEPGPLITFLKQAFGAEGELRSDRPTELKIGDSIVMVSSAEARESMPAFLYLYVDDADAAYANALAAGALTLERPWDTPYGDRRGMVRDPAGNIWQVATYKGT